MAGDTGLVQRARHKLEEVTGLTVTPTDRLSYLEETAVDARMLDRELRELAYTALDYVGGKPQDLKAEQRRRLAQKSRVVWMKDPQAGAAVDLKNDFVFGRGVSKPKAKDDAVQQVIDKGWNDPNNQRMLTSHEAQVALGTDMELQSNLFFLMFDSSDDGEKSKDGLVKLSLLDHDTVENVVEHPEDRFRVLYYVARSRTQEWDFKLDQPKLTQSPNGKPVVKYYEHWSTVKESKDDGDFPDGYKVDDAKKGDGQVFHVADNRTTEMHFGHPRFDRVLRWFNAYNRFMEARVDMMAAAAAFVMKTKVKGTPGQLEKIATRGLSRASQIGAAQWDPNDDPSRPRPPRGGGMLYENEGVEHEQFALNTNAGNAAQDARMLGAQVSAATRWPRIYFGDAEAGGSLATSTSLELPILKAVEARQELFERVFRWFTDRLIERAVDAGLLSKKLDTKELAEARYRELHRRVVASGGGRIRPTERPQDYAGRVLALVEAHEDRVNDEVSTERDLSYEFSMPNPLKRVMTDIITSIQLVAQTFDPNNTNTELSRILLAEALKAMELGEDVSDLVDRIFPAGYVDPAVAAAQAASQGPPGEDFGPFGPDAPAGGAPGAQGAGAARTGAQGADGQRHQASNPYGAPQRATPPEAMREAALPPWWPKDRSGHPLHEAAFNDLPADMRRGYDDRMTDFDGDMESTMNPVLDALLGNGNGRH